MNKVHKLNGFVYVTSEEEPMEDNYITNGLLIGKCRNTFVLTKSDKKIILTNDTNLKEVQQLTKEELDYCNSVDEVDVIKGYEGIMVFVKTEQQVSADKLIYKLIIPTQEEVSNETLEEFIKETLEGYDEIDFSTYKGFIELGAKWQAKQMYTEVLDQFINEIKSEFSDQNWDYLEFIKERVIIKQKQ